MTTNQARPEYRNTGMAPTNAVWIDRPHGPAYSMVEVFRAAGFFLQ
jgi:hypothetical protein